MTHCQVATPHRQRGGICISIFGMVQVGEKFPSKAEPAYQYSEVLHKSFLFYYQQRSGKLPHQVPLTLPK